MTETADYDGQDFYCDVAIPNAWKLDVVHDDDLVLAYHHTRPFRRVHILVVPKRHIASLSAVSVGDEPTSEHCSRSSRTSPGRSWTPMELPES